MIKEKALSKVKGYLTDLIPSEGYDEVEEIIKTLEQEPCEDCISRQRVLKLIKEKCNPYGKPTIDFEEGKKLLKHIDNLPPVTPQLKTGHWIIEKWNNKEHYSCSSCQHVVDYEPCYHYCPYCGAKMVEPQESEDKG